MCVIAVSRKGIRQPTKEQLQTMWTYNPHGAGYMYARDGHVTIHKGFMVWEDFYRAVCNEHFTAQDPVVYHFRISTQAGVNPSMTHPFPLTSDLMKTEALDIVSCPIGVAHNGIIRMTTDKNEKRFSDTALFVTQYMTRLIRNDWDMKDVKVLDMIAELTKSKWAIMNSDGAIVTIGDYVNDRSLLFSNGSYDRKNYFKNYLTR